MQSRSLGWLRPALEAVCTFPDAVRARVACELIHLCRHGPSAVWAPLRSASAVVAHTVKGGARNGSPRPVFRVCALPSAEDVVVLHAFDRKERQHDATIPEKHLAFIRARLEAVLMDRCEPTKQAARAAIVPAEPNPLTQMAFEADEARELFERATLVSDSRVFVRRSAHRPSPTLCKVLDGDITALGAHDMRAELEAARRAVGV